MKTCLKVFTLNVLICYAVGFKWSELQNEGDDDIERKEEFFTYKRSVSITGLYFFH